MKYIRNLIILFSFVLLFFSLSSSVSAQTCFCQDPSGDSGNWVYCEPDLTTPGNYTCQSTGSGGSGAHECCDSCGGSCDAPTTGGGGGGAYQYPTCGGSQVLKCGSDPVLYLSGGGGETNDANLASCSYKIGCGDSYFPSAFTETGCDGVESKGQCQTNCGCCNASDNYTKSTVTGSNYTREVSCFLSIPSLYCNDWDDTFVSRSYGTGAGNCYCNCENEDGCGANCTRGGNWVKNDIITCTSKTTTWSCVPTCTATSPSTPTLISPSNGSTISSTSVTLAWDNAGQTWGTACGSQNNQFRVYIGTSPSSLGLLGTVGSGTAGRLPESST